MIQNNSSPSSRLPVLILLACASSLVLSLRHVTRSTTARNIVSTKRILRTVEGRFQRPPQRPRQPPPRRRHPRRRRSATQTRAPTTRTAIARRISRPPPSGTASVPQTANLPFVITMCRVTSTAVRAAIITTGGTAAIRLARRPPRHLFPAAAPHRAGMAVVPTAPTPTTACAVRGTVAAGPQAARSRPASLLLRRPPNRSSRCPAIALTVSSGTAASVSSPHPSSWTSRATAST